VIGRRIEITADLARVQVRRDGQLVADHDRIWAKHQTITDTEHEAAARALRRERIELVRPDPGGHVEPEVEVRCLADYDTALGLHDDDGRHDEDRHDDRRRPEEGDEWEVTA